MCVFMGVVLALPGEKVFFSKRRHIIQLNPICAWTQACTHISVLLETVKSLGKLISNSNHETKHTIITKRTVKASNE